MGIKKKDILLACFLLFAACLLFFVLRPVKSGTGGWVRIMVDGKLYGTYPLSGKEKIRIGQDSGYNMVYIEDGAAWIRGGLPGWILYPPGKNHGKRTGYCMPAAQACA